MEYLSSEYDQQKDLSEQTFWQHLKNVDWILNFSKLSSHTNGWEKEYHIMIFPYFIKSFAHEIALIWLTLSFAKNPILPVHNSNQTLLTVPNSNETLID